MQKINRQNILRGALVVLLVSAAGWTAVRVAYSQQVSIPKEDRDRIVTTNTEGFIALPAEVIAGPQVTQIAPSPEGRYALVSRLKIDVPNQFPPPDDSVNGEASLVLWNSRNRRAVTVWRHEWNRESPATSQSFWLPGNRAALVVTGWGNMTRNAPEGELQYNILRPASASLTPLPGRWNAREFPLVHPDQPMVAMILRNDFDEKSTEPVTIRIIRVGDGNSTVSAPITLPQKDGTICWAQVPNTLYHEHIDRTTVNGKIVRRRTYLTINASDGTITDLGEKKPADYDASSFAMFRGMDTNQLREKVMALPIRLGGSMTRISAGQMAAQTKDNAPSVSAALSPSPGGSATQTTAKPGAKTNPGVPLPYVYLASNSKPTEEPAALLAADAQPVTLLADASAALYMSRGTLYAVPLLRVPKTAFLEMRRRAQQVVAQSNAKQIGLGLMMYVQDYDETYPPAQDVQTKVLPYIKNEEVFKNPATGENGFVYTFQGISLAKVDSPATTEIGYVTGPGGRAIIYADGHVKWRPDEN